MDTKENPPTKSVPPGIIDQNVEAIMALHNAELLSMTRHQRAIERIVLIITYPAFLFGISILIAIWIGLNIGLKLSGQVAWDQAPFGWLQTGVGVIALLMTSVIVITQSRQGRAAEKNAHLGLQINLLVDQKVAKVIQLLEEIRADSPNLRNRRDEQAEQMQVAVDPSHIAGAIADKLSTAGSAADGILNEAADYKEGPT